MPRFAVACVITAVLGFQAAAFGMVEANDPTIAAAEIGFTPESVAVSGLHGSVTTMLVRLDEANDLRATLMSHLASLSTISVQVAVLGQAAAADPSNSGAAAAHEAAIGQQFTLESLANQARQQLFEVITDGLPADNVQRLTWWRENRGRKVPAEFRIQEHSETAWTDIEQALIAEKRAVQNGETLDEHFQSLLAAIRVDPAVSTASAELAANLAAITAVFQMHSTSPPTVPPPPP